MNVYRIWTTRKNDRGQAIHIDLECNIPSLEDLLARLNDGQMVMGNQLYTRYLRDEEGQYLEIYKHKPVIVAAQAVATIEVPDLRFVRFVEE